MILKYIFQSFLNLLHIYNINVGKYIVSNINKLLKKFNLSFDLMLALRQAKSQVLSIVLTLLKHCYQQYSQKGQHIDKNMGKYLACPFFSIPSFNCTHDFSNFLLHPNTWLYFTSQQILLLCIIHRLFFLKSQLTLGLKLRYEIFL